MKALFYGAVAAAAMSAPAAQAATIVFNTTGANSTAATQTVTAGGVTASFTGGTYAGTVAAMNAANGNVALTAGTVQRSSTGLGVAADGEANQVDSNGANELLEVNFSTASLYRIVSATVGVIDNNDTFALFGGNGGVFTRLGFSGNIQSGLSGGIPVTTTSLGGNVYRLDFNYGAGFDSFRFGTNREESDGFSLRSLSIAGPVPEPSTWAMLILGFGAVGTVLRRKSREAKQGKAALRFA